MYVAVKGGERAIDEAHRQLAEKRRGDPAVPRLSARQIGEQLGLAVDRVMAEGALYDRDLAARAIRQAMGDLIEAAFLVRAYRTTLPRLAVTEPVDTNRMAVGRRVSATFKDLPGGQILGPTFDYTHRLLDLEESGPDAPDGPLPEEQSDDADEPQPGGSAADTPKVLQLLDHEGLIEPDEAAGDGAGGEAENGDGTPLEGNEPADLTREPLSFPAGRDARLQALARSDEGFCLGLAYSTQRGFGRTHPFAGEIRMGTVAIEIVPEELGFPVEIGAITLTECDMINQFTGAKGVPPQFTRGYGLVFGHSERKAMAMSLVDRAMRAPEFGEPETAPAQDQEFVLLHGDNVESSGFLQHLKLPHYVDFQAELSLLRDLRAELEGRKTADAAAGDEGEGENA
ncbi:MAG: carbon-phosphorus lyase complex subunit PhnI [Alphaproteobacteria bacterium]|jgi:alpha-D-ribose 1-methylphosphonate 5-triphosphate synthase subunit PhnI|nr:carbon-phosphorus lyase complex subunit PhnI [Alphaproteobacteria bacterium]